MGRLKEEFLALHAEEKKLEQRLRETKEHVEQLRLNRQQISRQKQEVRARVYICIHGVYTCHRSGEICISELVL